MTEALRHGVRAAAGRVTAALAARFRDLDLAEDAFSDACEAAARAWPQSGAPADPAAWLYRVALRRALDQRRKQGVRQRLQPEAPEPQPTAEDWLVSDSRLIPDDRLRLIFVCCHPAIAPESRAALTLRLVCGLSAQEIAAAFLLPTATVLQRLTRAKRKIAAAGVPFETPGRDAWPERLEAVLTTLEVTYAKAHEDAAGQGIHAGYAREMLALTGLLCELTPREGEVLGLAALVRYAEARRPARTAADGLMIPLSEQDPRLWRRALIAEADGLLLRAGALGDLGPRALAAAIHGLWCARLSLAEPPPWPAVLRVYDLMLAQRDDDIVRLNRAVALAEVVGPERALQELEAMTTPGLRGFQPWQAVRADLLNRVGRRDESRAAYDRAIALAPGPAERRWLISRRP